MEAQIGIVKGIIDRLKNDRDVRDVLVEMGAMMSDLVSGNSDTLKAKLTGYGDVDETLALVREGQEVRQRMKNRDKALGLIIRLANIAVRFAPVLAEAKEEIAEVKKSKKKKG